MDENDKLTIQQVAEATGLSVYTLRYYERIGLIDPIGRAENSHRRYTASDIGWIDFLTKLRCAGMSIQQMLTYTRLQRAGDDTLAERIGMLKAQRGSVEARIEELRDYLTVLDYKISYYEGVLAERTRETCQTETVSLS